MVEYNFPKYKLKLQIPDEVYEPAEDTYLLLSSIKLASNQKRVIEIGTGSGIISIFLAKKYPNVNFFATDISLIACQTAYLNSRNNNVSKNLEIICGHTLEALKIKEGDIIIWNPPYLPLDNEVSKLPIMERRNLFGGKSGYEETVHLLIQIAEQITHFDYFTIISSLSTDASFVQKINKLGKRHINYKIVDKHHCFFEDIYLYKFYR